MRLTRHAIARDGLRAHPTFDADDSLVAPADDEYPKQAWCDTCEEARLQDHGWFDDADAVAQWGWICDVCLSTSIEQAQHTTFVVGEDSPGSDSES